MAARDPRVDAYIAKSADFARPILEHIRQLVHEACPDVEETMKWNMPHFQYKGILCGMAAFKAHCAWIFWNKTVVADSAGADAENGMGQFGHIGKISDLPSKKTLIGYIKKAVQLNEDGVKSPARARPKQPAAVAVPDDLTSALQQNDAARATFERLSASHRREYVDWINEAKTDATRSRRLATTLEWLAEGKSRNWKYSKR